MPQHLKSAPEAPPPQGPFQAGRSFGTALTDAHEEIARLRDENRDLHLQVAVLEQELDEIADSRAQIWGDYLHHLRLFEALEVKCAALTERLRQVKNIFVAFLNYDRENPLDAAQAAEDEELRFWL